MNPKLQELNRRLTAIGGKPYMVGGCVRDHVLGKPVKDTDLEVFGNVSYESIVTALEGFELNLCGRAFAVIKVGHDIDISLPRRESKLGSHHTAFEIFADPGMTMQEASARRDFTINSMYMDFEGTIHDPNGGMSDLYMKTLRATSKAYKEDALRVLRAMQFAARFDLDMDETTIQMSKEMKDEYHQLSKERLWEEWSKWATKGNHTMKGLELLDKCGWLELYPQLNALVGVPQDPEWHPEGDVWVHTKLVTQAATDICNRDDIQGDARVHVVMGALCHDLGKATATVFKDGRWRAPGHAKDGVNPTKAFLKSIDAPVDVVEMVWPLVQEHMVHCNDSEESSGPTDTAVRRLSRRLESANINLLSKVIEADYSGRPPLPKGTPFGPWLAAAERVNVADAKPKQLVMGRDLLPLGVLPGKEMGVMLKKAYEAQLNGEFFDLAAGLKYLGF